MTVYIIRVRSRYVAVRVGPTSISVDLSQPARKRTGCNTFTSGGTGDQSIQRVARHPDTARYPGPGAIREEYQNATAWGAVDIQRVKRLDIDT